MKVSSLAAMAAALTATGCLPAAEKNQIIVDGEATIELEPELFSLSGSIIARDENQAAVLAEVARTLARMRETLPLLEGLTHMTIETADVVISPVYDPECVEKSRYNAERSCPVAGYLGSIGVGVKGEPASAAGQALSFLSELGAESVSLNSFELRDRAAADNQALDAAVRAARARADKIAAASGGQIVGPVRIQFGEGFSSPDRGVRLRYQQTNRQDLIVVTAERNLGAETDLDLEPQPIRVTSRVTAAFEIE